MRDLDFQIVERATLAALEDDERRAFRRFQALSFGADTTYPLPKPGVARGEWLQAQRDYADAANRLVLRHWLVGMGKLDGKRSA